MCIRDSHLVSCGDDVAITYHPEIKDQELADTPELYPLPKTIQTLGLDIDKRESIRQIVELLRPDVVYHLAAQTFVPEAEKSLEAVMQTNFYGSVNLFEAIRDINPSTKILSVSSSEVYGEPKPGSLPITEAAEIRPISNYGVTKSSADVAAYKYSQRDNVHIIRARPFPHIGPGQNSRFALSSFAKQLAEIKLGKKEPVLKVGNLESKRDYSDVSDIVRGYREALLNGKKGDAYNLCSGQSHEIGEILQRLITVAEVEVEVQEDPTRTRAVDINDIYGSYEKANKDFGWKPRIELEGTLHSLFGFWVEALG